MEYKYKIEYANLAKTGFDICTWTIGGIDENN